MAASLLVHAVLAGLVAFTAFRARPPEVPEALLPRLLVLLTTVNPQAQEASAPPESNAEALEEEAGIAPPPTETIAEISEVLPTEQDDAEEAGIAASSVADALQVPAEAPDGSEAVKSPGAAPGLGAEQLKASVTAYVSTYKSGLVQDWLTECQQFRNRYATRDCPTGEDANYAPHAGEKASIAGVFETWVTGHATNARISEQLVAESKYLAGLMEQEGVMGEIARQRYSMVRDQYCHLNPDVQACALVTVKSMMAKASAFASSGPASDVIFSISLSELVRVGEGKLHFLKGLFSVSKDGEVEFLDAPLATALPFTYPTERAAPATLIDDDTFQIAPPLFPLR